jgi:hypothetical protein
MVVLVFLLALAMVFNIDSDGYIVSIKKEKPLSNKPTNVKKSVSKVEDLLEDFIAATHLRTYLEEWLSMNSNGKKKYTVPVHIPYKISNRITLLSDKEEQELYERLKTRLSFYSIRSIVEKKSNAHVTLFSYNYYLVTDISFRNKMKGPYTILDVEVELDKTC